MALLDTICIARRDVFVYNRLPGESRCVALEATTWAVLMRETAYRQCVMERRRWDVS